MSGWKAKRFWKQATAVREADGWGVRLDARAVKTPAKAALIVPTAAMAAAIAAEWDAQHGEIRPETMPVTRAANAAIDKVAVQFTEVAAMIAEYGGSDLLCYRADSPAGLISQQAEAWDPLLDWLDGHYGARLNTTSGIVPVPQPAASLERLRDAVFTFDPFRLTALHDLVAIPGSLVIGLAIATGRLDAATGWTLSRIDEDWQARQWGDDEEARAAAAHKRAALLDAERFLALCRPD